MGAMRGDMDRMIRKRCENSLILRLDESLSKINAFSR